MLPVTFTTISLAAILFIPMTAWIGLLRGKTNILRGDGGNATLFKRSRIYGNLTEVLPVFLLVLGAAESTGLSARWLWTAVAVFVLGRVMHFVLYDNKSRGGAMFVTLLPGLAMGVWILGQIWG